MNKEISGTALFNTKIFLHDQADFPEWSRARFNPENRSLGIAISGGGSRAFCAGAGQLRALHSLGLIRDAGAVSYSSGSTWLGVVYHFADRGIDDDSLLGPAIDPGDLTEEIVHSSTSGGEIISAITDVPLLKNGVKAFFKEIEHGRLAPDRIFGRALGGALFHKFGIDNPNQYFTLDRESLTDILSRNPSLCPEDFVVMRQDRPYFLSGGTFLAPVDAGSVDPKKERWYQCEYTPLYAGLPQTYPGTWPSGDVLGGGWIEPFAFGSHAPVEIGGDIAGVKRPAERFSLSTLAGSSGGSFGIHLVLKGHDHLAPNFQYWSPLRPERSSMYDIVDSGTLENCAIVNLLRRGFKRIIAFVNSRIPVDPPVKGHCGLLREYAAMGLDGEVTRLFGVSTEGQLPEMPDIQVFPKEQLQTLAAGLREGLRKGGVATWTDTYEIVPDNYFAIAPYEVEIQWIYLSDVESWKEQITDPLVLEMFNDEDPRDYMENFPFFCADKQNKGEVLQFSPRQANLLSNLSCWSAIQALSHRCG